MNDLFGTHVDLADLLPPDGRSHEFDTIGDALGISMVHLQQYLAAAEQVLDTAIVSTVRKPDSQTIRASYADSREAARFLGSKWLKLGDGAVVFYNQWGYPTGMLREAVARTSGRYRIRVTGYAHQSDRPVTFSIGTTTFQRGADNPTFGYYSLPPGKASTVEIEAWIEARHMVRIEPWGISDAYAIKRNGLQNYQGPGLAILHVELEGPLIDTFPGPGHRLIFDGLQRTEIQPRNPADRNKPRYRPEFQIVSDAPATDAVPVLRRIASTAFRRPVTESEMTAYVRLFQSEQQRGRRFEDALRTAVTAIFCSPDFLYFRERPGRLDDYALASRLSYFLTRTTPDAELLKTAARGQLSEDRVLLQQTQRLLRHRNSERFIADFTDAWLDLRNIDFTVPDRLLYPEYDAYLKHSSVRETRAFFRELITGNLQVRNLVKSRFAMLNGRLARHYGIAGVAGPEIRLVELPSDTDRGGILTQSAVLKVSANGTSTSPVVRGVWVLERILGQTPPPPPAGISGVEPDIRGAQTLRELLARHRQADSCRACHQKIDPPGFALECFDPIGGYRDRFRSLGEGEKLDLQLNGNRVRYRLGREVDASGFLPDRGPFSGYRAFRDLLAEDEQLLARALTGKLLTFATGREMGFSDRVVIEMIARQTASGGYGVRDLILQAVQSDIFRNR